MSRCTVCWSSSWLRTISQSVELPACSLCKVRIDACTSTTRQDLGSEVRTLEAAVFEDDCAAITIRTTTYMVKVLHVGFKVEEEFQLRDWKSVLLSLPSRVCELIFKGGAFMDMLVRFCWFQQSVESNV